MPIIQQSTYRRAPLMQFNGHLQTILPNFKERPFTYERERIETPDDDFLDLDWRVQKSRKLVVLTHGLEGNSLRPYITSAAQFFYDANYDVLAWNCRSCSGEMNRQLRLYNHGEIGDIELVIKHALRTKEYEEIVLLGYSMGGNISMKYVGVHGKAIPAQIKAVVAVSSPAEMEESVAILEKKSNFIYAKKFMDSLKLKIEAKAKLFPEVIDIQDFNKVQSWDDFINVFNAPMNGYRDSADFYENASACNFVSGTAVPVLLINAQNDPILTPKCSPKALAEKHDLFHLETPKVGGHVGFALRGKSYRWSEWRALDFVRTSCF